MCVYLYFCTSCPHSSSRSHWGLSPAARPPVESRSQTVRETVGTQKPSSHGGPQGRVEPGGCSRKSWASGTGERLHQHGGCESFVFRRKRRIQNELDASGQHLGTLNETDSQGLKTLRMLGNVTGQEFQELTENRIILSSIGAGQDDLAGRLDRVVDLVALAQAQRAADGFWNRGLVAVGQGGLSFKCGRHDGISGVNARMVMQTHCPVDGPAADGRTGLRGARPGRQYLRCAARRLPASSVPRSWAAEPPWCPRRDAVAGAIATLPGRRAWPRKRPGCPRLRC